MAGNKYEKAMEQAAGIAVKRPEPEPTESAVEAPRTPVARGVGRPPGKRSNPDWEQATVFIRKDTKRAALMRLMETGSNQDFSELVDQLLAKWARNT